MQNAELEAKRVLHSAFCILHSSNLPLLPAVLTYPLTEEQVRQYDSHHHDGRDDSCVQMKNDHGGHAEGDDDEVEAPNAHAAAARVFGAAVRTDAQRAASPRSFSTMTVSRHSPSSFPGRSYVPTSRKPSARRSARLAVFSTMTRETSFQNPAASAAFMSASMATRPTARARGGWGGGAAKAPPSPPSSTTTTGCTPSSHAATSAAARGRVSNVATR